MKKTAIIVLISAALLAGCSSGNNNKGASPEATIAPTSTTKVEETAKDTDKADTGGTIEVDKNLLSVEITLPATMLDGQNIDQLIADANDSGINNVTKNDDGSVTYKMSKSVHDDMMKELAAGLSESLIEMKDGETFVSIKDVTHNDKYSEFEVIVDKSAYEGSFDAFATFGLGIQGMYYQVFDGVSSDKLKVTINIKDQGTGEVFDTVVYPDDIAE